ncbi:MAG: hypothetical protein LBC99_11400 [Spirochaetota bacterium]|jgi:hypothetical protein|nr:hypothetical protein [Spirochaetota bacterium]
MKTRILSLIIVLILAFAFAQCSDGTDNANRQIRGMHAMFAGAEKETPEMQAKRAEFYTRGAERISKAVAAGKMDQAKANYLTKWMENDKAFKDANPEWTKYLLQPLHGKKGDGKKFEGKKGDKKDWEAKKEAFKKAGAEKVDRPKPTSAEIKAKHEGFYQKHVERINKSVADGKMEKAHADFILKWMANDKAFKDANPEWAEYGFFGGPHHGKPGKFGKDCDNGAKTNKAK